MNIYLHELKAYRRSTLIWTSVICAVVLILLSFFPAFSESSQDLQDLFRNIPPELTQGLGIDLSSIFSVTGYYTFIFLYISLCGAIQAMNLSLSVLSKETTDKTCDFLLTKPRSRFSILSSKLLAVFTCILFTNIIFSAVAVIAAGLIAADGVRSNIFYLITFSLFFMQVIFAGIGILLSALFSRIRSITPVSLGIVFSLYIIKVFASAVEDRSLKLLSPFEYFDSMGILQNSSYDSFYSLIAAGIVLVCIIVTYVVYCRKDIHAV